VIHLLKVKGKSLVDRDKLRFILGVKQPGEGLRTA
jgi:hypothetical protein